MQNLNELFEAVGEDVLVDGESAKAKVEFGVDENGFNVKMVSFIGFKETYEKVVLRGKEYGVISEFTDEFGVVKLQLGELNE